MSPASYGFTHWNKKIKKGKYPLLSNSVFTTNERVDRLIVLYLCISVMSLYLLKRIAIKNTYIIRTGFEKDTTPFNIKILSVFLFVITMSSFILVIHEILSYLNKTEGSFAIYSYFIFLIVYLVFIINFISRKHSKD